MYPESARKVRSWFPCGYLFGETNVEFESYRACTGEFLCYRVAKDYRHDDFNYDEPKRQFLGNVRSFVGTDQYHPSFDDKEFVSYSASLFQHDIGTFSTLEGLGDDLHKWIFVERDFDMLELRLLSMKTIAYHLHGGSGLKWMLLTDAADTPWRGGRHTAADWLMLIDDLLDRLRTETPSATRMEMLKYKIALEDFARFIQTLDDRPSPDDESDDEDDTPAKRRRTELVQKIGSILDENTGAMKENDYRVAMDALKELM